MTRSIRSRLAVGPVCIVCQVVLDRGQNASELYRHIADDGGLKKRGGLGLLARAVGIQNHECSAMGVGGDYALDDSCCVINSMAPGI